MINSKGLSDFIERLRASAW